MEALSENARFRRTSSIRVPRSKSMLFNFGVANDHLLFSNAHDCETTDAPKSDAMDKCNSNNSDDGDDDAISNPFSSSNSFLSISTLMSSDEDDDIEFENVFMENGKSEDRIAAAYSEAELSYPNRSLLAAKKPNEMKDGHSERVAMSRTSLSYVNNNESYYEKTIDSLQKGNAVLTAAVEERDSKLTKMADLQQKTVASLAKEVTMRNDVQKDLKSKTVKCGELQNEITALKAIQSNHLLELAIKNFAFENANRSLDEAKTRGLQLEGQIECVQSKNRLLCAERDKMKLELDTLSQQMEQLCPHGRNINEVEDIIEERNQLKKEMLSLKTTKRLSSLNAESLRAIDQRLELEKMISNLTEYVHAKEMQLETLKEVNKTLLEEIRVLAMAQMNDSDI